MGCVSKLQTTFFLGPKYLTCCGAYAPLPLSARRVYGRIVKLDSPLRTGKNKRKRVIKGVCLGLVGTQDTLLTKGKGDEKNLE